MARTTLLLCAAFAVARPSGASFAQSAPAEHTRAQRPISEDPLIDQNLVVVARPRTSQASDEADLQVASTGPAMLALRTTFAAFWPTHGEITTYFGEVSPLSRRGHAGLDIAAPEGTPITAADDGEVLKAYWSEDGYGGLVVIAHVAGYETWYGHLEQIDVVQGQRVKRGQAIALMGSTGFSTGAHLHFEVREEGQLRDPLAYLSEAALKPAV